MRPANEGRLRIGTRGSALARWQAEWVAAQLACNGIEADLVPITARGDVTAQPLTQVGGQGLFTKEIQRALLAERVDLAVHSLKDLPTLPVPGLLLAAIPARESHRDVLVSRQGLPLADLPAQSVVGTGSRRRQTQVLHLRPDLRLADIRGNVETRLSKLDQGDYDAVILAEAGLRRLGLSGRVSQILSEDLMLPAVGQGALAIECREEDQRVREILGPLDDPATRAAVLAERALLAALRAGCLAPVGAWGRTVGDRLDLDAAVLSMDGKERLSARRSGTPDDPQHLGATVADLLLAQGAGALVAAARQ